MKTNGIHQVVALLFIAFGLSFMSELRSQIVQTTRPMRVKIGDLEKEKISTVAGIEVNISPDVPIIEMLGEPKYTAGNSNILFWESLPDPVEFEERSIPLRECLIIPMLGMNPDSLDVVDGILGDIVSYEFSDLDKFGINLYFGAYLAVKSPNDGLWYSNEELTVVSSIQDITAPILHQDSLFILDANFTDGRKGWINTDSIYIRFDELMDSAGVYSSKITGALEKDSIYIESPDGLPDSTSRSGYYLFDKGLKDGILNFSFGACDAAYSPLSRGPINGDEATAVWLIAGNCADTLFAGAAKLDRVPPNINVSTLKSVYSSNEKLADGTIDINVPISDALSGVEFDTLSVAFSPPLDFNKSIIKTDSNTGELNIKLFNIVKDTTATLTIWGMDIAGNDTLLAKEIQFIVEPPVLTSCRISDIDFGDSLCITPAITYTNNNVVRLDSFHFRAEFADFLKIIGKDDSVTVPYQESFEFDLEDVWQELAANPKPEIEIRALDEYGNEQPTGITKSIFFDDQLPVITQSVSDTNTVDEDPRNGAYPNYTNSETVIVSISSPDSDLFTFEKSSPVQQCRDASDREFLDTIVGSNDADYKFTYQAGDSAGNVSAPATSTIKFLDQRYETTSSDFTVSYRSTNLEKDVIDDSVYIAINEPEKFAYLSRIVVDDNVYEIGNTNRITVAIGSAKYFVSLVDSAGNESTPVEVEIDTIPPEIMTLELADINDVPQKAVTGYTDSLVVLLSSSVSSDVDSIYLSGDAEAVLIEGSWRDVPATVPYLPKLFVRLKKTESLDSKTVACNVRDLAGNWSDESETNIVYLNQPITVSIDFIDSESETLTIPFDEIKSDSLIFLDIRFSCDYPEFIRNAVTGDTLLAIDTLWTPIDIELCDRDGDDYICKVPFKVWTSGNMVVRVSDCAGNASNKAKIYFDIQVRPEISFTVYDYSEFPAFGTQASELPDDWQRSDSLFVGESQKLAALTKLSVGNWDSIRIAPFSKDSLPAVSFESLANKSDSIDIRVIDFQVDTASVKQLVYYAEVKNKAGLKDTASASIFFDIASPNLSDFRQLENANVVSDNTFKFSYLGSDGPDGEIAGIIIKEILLGVGTTPFASTYHYVPAGADQQITLNEHNGLRNIKAFLVDMADVDQNRPEVIQAKLDNKDLSGIQHRSNEMEIEELRLNALELSSYPNPFNPKSNEASERITKLIFHLSEASNVEISILDPFGHLVYQGWAEAEKGMNDGHYNDDLCWNGQNNNGDFVANGGYICVIRSEKTGEQYLRKIAVLKK